jgi:hypothetical protein
LLSGCVAGALAAAGGCATQQNDGVTIITGGASDEGDASSGDGGGTVGGSAGAGQGGTGKSGAGAGGSKAGSAGAPEAGSGGASGSAGTGTAGSAAGSAGKSGSAGASGSGTSGSSASGAGGTGTSGTGAGGKSGAAGTGGSGTAGTSAGGVSGSGTAGTSGSGTAGASGSGTAGTGAGGGTSTCAAVSENFESGLPSSWTLNAAAAWSVLTDSGKMSQVLSGTGKAQAAGSAATCGDQTVSADVNVVDFSGTSDSNRAGVMVRYTDASTFYALEIDGAGALVLRRSTNTLSGCGDVAAGITPGSWHNLKLQVSGPAGNVTLKSYLDGVAKQSCTLTASPSYATGKAGAVIYQITTAEFDNFVITSP